MSIQLQSRELVFLSLVVKVKQIIESTGGMNAAPNDFTYLMRYPDEEQGIVFPEDHEPGITIKTPFITAECNDWEDYEYEMGGTLASRGTFWIDVHHHNPLSARNIAEFVAYNTDNRLIRVEHPIYDFNNVTTTSLDEFINLPYDPASLPPVLVNAVGKNRNFLIKDKISQTNISNPKKYDPNMANRAISTLSGEIIYLL